MHNLKDLRKNLDIYKKKFKDRNLNFNIEEFTKIDKDVTKISDGNFKIEVDTDTVDRPVSPE